jgi:hypothetical protein
MLLRTFQGPVERATGFTLPSLGLGAQPLTGPLSITQSTTLSIPAAYRCVQIISDTAASLPLHSYRGKMQLNRTPDVDPGGPVRVAPHRRQCVSPGRQP